MWWDAEIKWIPLPRIPQIVEAQSDDHKSRQAQLQIMYHHNSVALRSGTMAHHQGLLGLALAVNFMVNIRTWPKREVVWSAKEVIDMDGSSNSSNIMVILHILTVNLPAMATTKEL